MGICEIIPTRVQGHPDLTVETGKFLAGPDVGVWAQHDTLPGVEKVNLQPVSLLASTGRRKSPHSSNGRLIRLVQPFRPESSPV